jgi:hypothetical protein
LGLSIRYVSERRGGALAGDRSRGASFHACRRLTELAR